MNDGAAVHTVTYENQTRSFATVCRDVSVASGVVPTGKEDAQKTWKAGDTVSVLSYAVRTARSLARCYRCTASARCPRKSTRSSCRR